MSDINTKEQQPTQPQEEKNNQEQINYKELYVRLAADLQNFKRRIEKERLDWTETAQGMILSAFLPIFEDIDRAVDVANQQQSTNDQQTPVPFLDGVKLIQKNLKKTLADLGVNEIDASGLFNPEYHEALAQIESPTQASGTIVQVFNKGYMFKGKILKHAQVSVAK